MNFQMRILGWSIGLGLVHVFFAAVLATGHRGLKWNACNRDTDPVPLSGLAARAERARNNFMETFPFFAAAILAVEAMQVGDAHTTFGAETYLWARVGYLLVYSIGIPYLRTLVWATSFWGLLQLLEALL